MGRALEFFLIVSAAAILEAGCMKNARKDINQVLAAHEKELMQIPGVVGVFVGLADDEKTECIKVMLKAPDLVAEKRIPKQVDGYRVITEVTGVIRPLQR